MLNASNIMVMQSTNQALFAIGVITLVICAVPLILEWEFSMCFVSKKNVWSALRSSEYQNALVVSLGACIPSFFEQTVRTIRCLTNRRSLSTPNCIIPSLILAIPNLILLSYVTGFTYLNALNYVLNMRLVVILWVTLSHIIHYDANYWSCRSLMIFFFSECICKILLFYGGYSSCYYSAVLIGSLVLSTINLSIFTVMVVRWYYRLLLDRKGLDFTVDQNLCGIYMIALLFCLIGELIINISSTNNAYWPMWTTNYLTSHIVIFSIFYIIIQVYEFHILGTAKSLITVFLRNSSVQYLH